VDVVHPVANGEMRYVSGSGSGSSRMGVEVGLDDDANLVHKTGEETIAGVKDLHQPAQGHRNGGPRDSGCVASGLIRLLRVSPPRPLGLCPY